MMTTSTRNHCPEAEMGVPQTDAPETSGNECELSVALAEHLADISAGRFVKESVSRHMARLTY
jgi:hypothetical protein